MSEEDLPHKSKRGEGDDRERSAEVAAKRAKRKVRHLCKMLKAGSAFKRAADRAGIKGVNLKALRAKAATDAKAAGYEIAQIKVGMAHTDESMTEQYIKMRLPERSEIVMKMPTKKEKNVVY